MHREHGPGRLLALRPGARARVRLEVEPGLPRTVPLAELTPGTGGDRAVGGRRSGVSPRVDAEPRPKLEAEPELDLLRLASLRQAIEALRLGVVPAEHVSDYTVGRERQLARVEELLREGGGLRVVWGDYGAGKTHLLDIVEELGRKDGFMTARIVLDPREVPPTHPKRLYSALVEHVRYPNDLAQGLEPLFRRLVRSDGQAGSGPTSYSRFYSAFLHALDVGDPDLLDWMRDYVDGCYMDVADGNRLLRRRGWQGDNLLTLSDYRTYGRMYVHLLGTVATWARDAGFGGLLLLFDEVEFVDALSRTELEYALEVLKHFAAVTVPRGDLGFDPDDLYRGGHQVHRRIPLRFSEDQPLAVVFALTPLEEIHDVFRRIVPSEKYDLGVTALGRADCEELVRKVVVLYQRAYPGYAAGATTQDELFAELHRGLAAGEDSPRSIVRACVFQLDRDRLARPRSE